MKIRKIARNVIVVGILITFIFVHYNCSKKQDAWQGEQQVQEYAVITVQPTRAELKSSYPAVIRGKQDIEIRPNVSGFITQVLVDEGDIVKKGQVLFKIDPIQYQAAVASAEANVNVAKAALQTSLLTLQNKRNLRDKGIISNFEVQTAENDYATQLATLDQANAELLNARNNLSYTNVTSPSDGVVGTIPYRIGSLVSPSITEPLTIVSDINEMFIYFSMTEKQLLELTRENGNVNIQLNKMPDVELQLADGTLYPAKGKIETVSGVIDSSTGSTTMRANFPNGRRILRSGGTGVILIPHVINQAIVIPQKATTDLQDKKFVFVVADSSKVKSTEIETYNLDNGKDYIVTKGLKSGDRIVVEGVGNLRDGTPIKPITPEEADARVKQMSQSGTEGKEQDKQQVKEN